MNVQQRGSEKLFAVCTDLQTLSQEELGQVAGAGLLSSPMGVWKVFPRGIPWPEIYRANDLAPNVRGLEGAGGLIGTYS